MELNLKIIKLCSLVWSS